MKLGAEGAVECRGRKSRMEKGINWNIMVWRISAIIDRVKQEVDENDVGESSWAIKSSDARARSIKFGLAFIAALAAAVGESVRVEG